MDSNIKKLESLQEEAVTKEKIALAVYGGLSAFSFTCLLRLMTLPSESIIIIPASCLFTISAISFLLISLSKQHVLLQAKDLHIGHIFSSEDLAKYPRTIGAVSLSGGFLLILLFISWVTFLVGAFSLVLALQQHFKFVREMKGMRGAREALKERGAPNQVP